MNANPLPESTLPDDAVLGMRYEKLYTMLLDAIPSSVLLIDSYLRVVSVNKNFLVKTRRSKRDTIGHPIDAVFPAVIISGMRLERRIQQVFQQNEPIQGERMTYRAPGVPLRIYYYSIIPVTWSGTVENVMFLMDDVTEQIRLSEEIRQVERHLASVVESASDIVLSTDSQGRILTWNLAAEKISGFSPSEVKGRFLFECCIPPHQDQIKKAFGKIETLGKLGQREWELMTKNDHGVSISWVCSTMNDDTGRVTGAVAVGRDLTERRKLEAQLLQSQKLAALGVMAGGIAHEIRNPLAIASSAAQFLLEEDIDPEFGQECAQKIHAGIHRASTIIENLLRFARPAGVRDMKPVDLSQVVKDTFLLVANEARLQKIEINMQLPAAPLVIIGHVNMLQQMIVNLTLNAYKAMPEGGEVSLRLECMKKEAILKVSDTGCGIPRGELSKIFDPFYTTRPVGEGTGLGLSLCYSIVQQHFGAIEVESVEGNGTSFIVRFPVHES